MLTTGSLGVCDLNLCFVFTRDSLGVGTGYAYTLILFRGCGTDRTVSVCLSNRDLRVVDSLCGCFFTESGDVSAFVADIGYVNVDEAKTDFLKLGFHVARNRFKEFVTVGVDLLDVHRCDYKTELTEDDILCELLDLNELETEKTLCCVLHYADVGGDTYGESGGNVNTNVLMREGVGKVNGDREGRQIEVFVSLEYGPYESRAAVDTLCRALCAVLVRADLTVDDHDLVGGTFLIARGYENDEGKEYCNDCNNDHRNCFRYSSDSGGKKSVESEHDFFLSLSLFYNIMRERRHFIQPPFPSCG